LRTVCKLSLLAVLLLGFCRCAVLFQKLCCSCSEALLQGVVPRRSGSLPGF